MFFSQSFKSLFLVLVLVGCAINPKPSDIKELETNVEYEEVIQIKKIEPEKNEATTAEEGQSTKNIESAPTKQGPQAKPPTNSTTSRSEKSSEQAPLSAGASRPQGRQDTEKEKKNSKSFISPESTGQSAPSGSSSTGKAATETAKKANDKSASNDGGSAQQTREPSIEDDEGFDGRRPLVDPFKVGEVLTYDANYGVISAGKVKLKTHPYVEVNGRKSYYFTTHADSNSVFSVFYKVRDWAETYVDFANLIPYSYALHVRESKQYREAKNFFDWKNLEASYWEKRIRNDKLREKKQKWKIYPYSQNVISAFFYMRAFRYRVGKKIKFRVADKGKNLTVTLTAIKKETLDTNAGKFETIKCEADFTYDGVFKPVGKVFVWFTDDDRRLITKIDAKIKIGTVSLDLEKVER